ncbi:Hypothetical predicted protein [Octopus vulgaris]|uniref:Uncharacterized protein n=1 Tax=Octopus vulgaris TaxID=6645 RepID=A0AA36FFB7_OCTVU|nr:Hypothetical predicted protein [Octopus vulgaris]
MHKHMQRPVGVLSTASEIFGLKIKIRKTKVQYQPSTMPTHEENIRVNDINLKTVQDLESSLVNVKSLPSFFVLATLKDWRQAPPEANSTRKIKPIIHLQY